MPDYLLQLEREQNLNPGSISQPQSKTNLAGLVPKRVTTYAEDLQLEEFPCIVVAVEGKPSTKLLQINRTHPALRDETTPPDGEEYQRSYAVRLWCYVMNQTYETVIESRGFFELAVWRCLFDGRMLADNAAIDKNSWIVSNAEAEQSLGPKNLSMVSGFTGRLVVNVSEVVTAIPLGIADTINTNVYRLPADDQDEES